MRRTIVLALGCTLALSVGGVAQYVGLLGEMVPWSLASVAYVMLPLPLRASPLEDLDGVPVGAPGVASYSYGLIPVGTGADPGITIAVCQDPVLRIWVDEGNDETLANDRERTDGVEIHPDTFRWTFTVQVEYASGEGVRSPYQISLLADRDSASGEYEFFYSGFCYRSGLLDLGDSVVPIAINSLDSTGRYDDVSQLVVAVDTDGDGELDIIPGSQDVYAPGEPIQVGTTLYAIDAVSVDGRRVVVHEAGQAPPRPIIAVGEPAPEFELVTLAGDRVALSEFRGKPVVLLLGQLPAYSGCSTCSRGASSTETTLTEFLDLARSFREAVTFVIVLTDSAPEQVWDFGSVPPHVFIGHGPDVARIYRRMVGNFVIDSQGVIAAMDRTWMSFVCGRPQGGTEALSPGDVAVALTRLVGE
jgi:hypothetical protein